MASPKKAAPKKRAPKISAFQRGVLVLEFQRIVNDLDSGRVDLARERLVTMIELGKKALR